MERDDCLITGSEPIDSNTLNRCLYGLYSLIQEKSAETIGSTSENYPETPFYKDGCANALTDHPVISRYGLVPASVEAEGVVPRLYYGTPNTGSVGSAVTATETPTGVYHYPESVIQTFPPTVESLYSDIRPCIFSSLLGDGLSMLTTGTSAAGSASNPTIKFTSFLVCGYTGVSFGTITFSRAAGDVQENVLSLNIRRDLINLDNVDAIRFLRISNGIGSGIRTVSEDRDVVSDMCECTVTYVSEDDVVVSNITKTDAGAIRIDRKTGRILDEDEKGDRTDCISLDNDECVLEFFVVFDLTETVHSFDESTWCFYVTADREYARTKLYSADSYARGNIKYGFLGFEAADDGYEDDYSNDNAFTMNGSHVCHNAVTTAKNAFNGCYNAQFPLLCYFSSNLVEADGMFKDCHRATFDSFPSNFKLDKLRTARSMFENCAMATFGNVERIELQTSRRLEKMFAGCDYATFSMLSSLEMNGNCSYMFNGDYYAEFGRLDHIEGNITVLNSMFEGCSNATFDELDRIISTSTTKVIANSMFSGLAQPTFYKLQLLSIGNAGYDAVSMFEGCSNATFPLITTIGEVVSGDAMFKDCVSATFTQLTGFGNSLSSAASMFEGHMVMALTAEQNFPSLISADHMFDANVGNASTVVVNGNMNRVKTASHMFADCLYARMNGDMNLLEDGSSMFMHATSAYVYGSMDRLSNADSMFFQTKSAYMASIPPTVTNMFDMFAESDSCCVADYNGSLPSRLCNSAFQNTYHAAITGNIFSGSVVSMSHMFDQSATKPVLDSDGNVVSRTVGGGTLKLVNPTMSGPDDAEHRYFTSQFTTDFMLSRPIGADDGSDVGNIPSVMYGGSLSGDDLKNCGFVDDSVTLTLHCTNAGVGYTINTFHDGVASVETVLDTDAPDYEYDGMIVEAASGERSYIISSVVHDDAASPFTKWSLMRDDGHGFHDMDYAYMYSGGGTIRMGETASLALRNTANTADLRKITLAMGGTADSGYFLRISTTEAGAPPQLATLGTTYSYATISFDFTEREMQDGTIALDIVAVVKSGSKKNVFAFRAYGGTTATEMVEVFSADVPPLLMDGKTPYNAKFYQLHSDSAHANRYAFFVVAKSDDDSKCNFFMYHGMLDEAKNPFEEQGDIFSIQTIFDATPTTLDAPPPILEVGLETNNGMSETLLYTNDMFRDVVAQSVLSGYDDVIAISLVDARGMFALTNPYSGLDNTFQHVGNIFKNMQKSSLRYADEMFLNRHFESSNPFAFGSSFSFHLPNGLASARKMFYNASIGLDDADEIGFALPPSLSDARSMFDGYSGGLVRFAHNMDGQVFVNDGLRSVLTTGGWESGCDRMFYGVSFANEPSNKYSISIPSMRLPMFHGSDFEFGDITEIVDRSGIYFREPITGRDGEYTLHDKFITSYATLDSLTGDISSWFSEGVFLASVLGPDAEELPDGVDVDEYRLMTGYNTFATITDRNLEFFKNLCDRTNSFKGGNILTIANPRIGFMFAPGIGLLPATNGSTFGSETCLATAAKFSNDELLAYAFDDSFMAANRLASYGSATFERLRDIDCEEAPFGFACLGSATFASLTSVGGQCVNATSMFFGDGRATFSSLERVNIQQMDSATSFGSRFIDVAEHTDYFGNYNSMFRGCTSATFENLDTISVRSSFFKLYPSDGDNMLHVYITTENGTNYMNCTTVINGVKRDVRIVPYLKTVVSGGAEVKKWAVKLRNNDYNPSDADSVEWFMTTDSMGLPVVSEAFLGMDSSPVPSIKYEFVELNRSYSDDESEYEFAVVLTVDGMIDGNLVEKFFSITDNTWGEPTFYEHAIHPTKEYGYGKLHTTFPISDAYSSSYYYHAAELGETLMFALQEDESCPYYKFRVVDFEETAVVKFDTGMRSSQNATVYAYCGLEYDGTWYDLIVDFRQSGRNITVAYKFVDKYEQTLDSEPQSGTKYYRYDGALGDYVPLTDGEAFEYGVIYYVRTDSFAETTEIAGFRTAEAPTTTVQITSRTPPTTKVAGEFLLDFLESSDSTYNFAIMRRRDNEIVSFITNVPKTNRISFIDVYETAEFGDKSVMVKFYGTGVGYAIHEDHTISEDITQPVPVRYRVLMGVSELDKYSLLTQSFCDAMFADCSEATMENLKVLSLGSSGTCSRMFWGCSKLSFKNLEVLYLPHPIAGNLEIPEHAYYKQSFKGVDLDNISLSKLDAMRTNLGTFDCAWLFCGCTRNGVTMIPLTEDGDIDVENAIRKDDFISALGINPSSELAAQIKSNLSLLD